MTPALVRQGPKVRKQGQQACAQVLPAGMAAQASSAGLPGEVHQPQSVMRNSSGVCSPCLQTWQLSELSRAARRGAPATLCEEEQQWRAQLLPAAQAEPTCPAGDAHPAGQVVEVNQQEQQPCAQLLPADMGAQGAQQDSWAGRLVHGSQPGMANI